MRDEAAKGTDFATLVRRYSKYDGPAQSDGDVGFVSLGSLQPQIRAGLDSLETGQVSEVLVNQAGFNIFKVTDRKPEREYSLEEIREELPDAVAQTPVSREVRSVAQDVAREGPCGDTEIRELQSPPASPAHESAGIAMITFEQVTKRYGERLTLDS